MHFSKYLKAAFVNHWNLLIFLGSAAFAVISGHPDALLPIVNAAWNSDPRVVEILLAAGANPNRTTRNLPIEALFPAATRDDPDGQLIVRDLLAAGANPCVHLSGMADFPRALEGMGGLTPLEVATRYNKTGSAAELRSAMKGKC